MALKKIDEFKIFDDNLIKNLNELAKRKRIEYWDLRCELNKGTNLEFTNKRSKKISSHEILECGIRTFINGGWGFNVVKEITKQAIMEEFERTIKLALLSESLSINKFKIEERDPIIQDFEITPQKGLLDVEIQEKIELVKSHEKKALDYSSKVKNTHTIYLDNEKHSIFQNSNGSTIYQYLTLLRLFNSVYAQDNGVIQQAGNSIGGLGGFEMTQTEKAQGLSLESAEQAVELLKAKSPKGGKFDIIMDPKLAGTLIHEAFGHACEADLVLNDQSLLKGLIGEKVANDKVNIVDNPTMGGGKMFNIPYELYGSYFIDDEGIPSQKTYLIENGILSNFLHSLETSSRMKVAPNGHGRAASTSDKPIVRMGVTLLEPKDWSLEEMVEDTKNGIYCKDFQYGYTDPTTGNFQFKCKISQKINNGKYGEIMRDVSLSGMILEILNRIEAIGKRSEMGFSDGTCGKGGQGIRVCDGGPPLLIKDVTVGGLS